MKKKKKRPISTKAILRRMNSISHQKRIARYLLLDEKFRESTRRDIAFMKTNLQKAWDHLDELGWKEREKIVDMVDVTAKYMYIYSVVEEILEEQISKTT